MCVPATDRLDRRITPNKLLGDAATDALVVPISDDDQHSLKPFRPCRGPGPAELLSRGCVRCFGPSPPNMRDQVFDIRYHIPRSKWMSSATSAGSLNRRCFLAEVRKTICHIEQAADASATEALCCSRSPRQQVAISRMNATHLTSGMQVGAAAMSDEIIKMQISEAGLVSMQTHLHTAQHVSVG